MESPTLIRSSSKRVEAGQRHSALETIVNDLIANNPAQVEQYRAADEGKQKKLIGFFVGQAMKASKGQANPQMLNQLLKENSIARPTPGGRT